MSGLIYVDYKIGELNDDVNKNYEKLIINSEELGKLKQQITINEKQIEKLTINGTDIPNTKPFHSIVKDVAKFIVRTNDTKKLSQSLGNDRKNLYYWVQNNIKYNMNSPYEISTNVLKHREGDCIGMADLLASLFIDSGYTNVKVVIGYINFEGQVRIHGWVETLDDSGKMIVLDPSTFIGTYDYDKWDVNSYYKANNVYPIVQYNDQIVDPNLEIIQSNN